MPAIVNGSAPTPLSVEQADKARAKRKALVKPRPGLPPAGQVAPDGGIERTEFFSRLKPPMENGTGKAPGAKR